MKKSILLVVLLTLVAFVSGAIAAAPPKAAGTAPAPAAPASTKAKVEKFSGEVKNVDAMAKSIVVAKGKEEKTFATDDMTKIMKGKEALKLEDLKAGMNVSIEYKKEMDKNIAVAIKASAPKAAPKKK
jgi:Cu/Ag efflux protein CusF